MCFKFLIIKWFEHETEFHENTHIRTLKQILAPSHTYTHAHWCVFKELSVLVCSQLRIRFALLCTTHQSTREFIKVCLPHVEGEMPYLHPHTHTHVHSYTHLEIDTAAISSYQEITTNLQVPHKCLTKSFWKAFTDFATSQRFLCHAWEGGRRVEAWLCVSHRHLWPKMLSGWHKLSCFDNNNSNSHRYLGAWK